MARFKATFADVQAVVNENNKKRFELKQEQNALGADTWFIRAVQGHSIEAVKDEDLLDKVTTNITDKENVFNFNAVCHGTYTQFLKPIMETGLCRMSRNGIHFAPEIPGAAQVISGMRTSCDVVVQANVIKSAYNQVPWFVSKNRVILTPGTGDKGFLEPKFFRSVFDAKSRQIIHSQPFDYICMFDLECNCSEDRNAIAFNEIIELPVVIIDVKNKEILEPFFHTYVKPTIEK